MASRTDTTEFLVTILEGPFAGDVIALAGRSLPYRSSAGGQISFGGTQRSKLIYYQGNPRATHLVFGPTIDPTTINGVWKDRYLGDEAAIDLVEAFELLRDAGVQVRVEWSTIERQGIIKTFVWKPGDPTGGLSDIAWEMTFEWNSKGEPPFRSVSPPQPALRDQVTSCATGFNDFRAAVSSFLSAAGSFLGSADIAFLPTKESLQGFLDASAPAQKAIATDASKIGNDQGLDLSVVEDASAQIDYASQSSAQIAAELATLFPATVTKQDDVDVLLIAFLDRFDVVEAAFSVLEQDFETRRALEQMARPAKFTEIPAKQGTDLRQVARDFYGNSDLWDRIAAANGIETSLVPPDVISLVIPLDLPDTLSPRGGTVGA